MDVRRASGGVHAGIGEEVRESSRTELTRIIGVKRTDQAVRRVCFRIQQGGKRGDELPNVERCLSLAAHWIRGFVARVVIDENKEVLMSSVSGTGEGTRDVCVDEAASVRGPVEFGLVAELVGVSFRASGAPVETP
eukprot:5114241-Pleurochrysis_carterae.AAC.1